MIIKLKKEEGKKKVNSEYQYSAINVWILKKKKNSKMNYIINYILRDPAKMCQINRKEDIIKAQCWLTWADWNWPQTKCELSE